MKQLVSLNGSLIDSDSAAVRALTPAVLYGRGVFTTLTVDNGEPFLWDKHWRRVCDDAVKIAVDLTDHTEQNVYEALRNLLASGSGKHGRCRITFFDTSSTTLWPHHSEQNTSVLLTLGTPHTSGSLLRLGLSAYQVNSRSPLAGIKSCNYLENILAFENARVSGSDEAVRINEKGEIASACMANIFWLEDDQLFTPALSTGCIAGTTRELIVETFDCEEVTAGEIKLHRARAIFLTSSGVGVRQATSYLSQAFAPSHHPILKLLTNAE